MARQPPPPLHLPASLVAQAFAPPAAGIALDFDAVGAPRRLRPRPVEADADPARTLRGDLAWFWNSNGERAEEQIAVGESYAALAARLLGVIGLRAGDRVVLSASEPDARRVAWRSALPGGVSVSDWRPRKRGRLFLPDLEPLLDGRTRLVLYTKACAVTGSLNEVIPVAQRLSGSGVTLVAEASHFMAHGPLDLRNLRCDAVIADGGELFGAGGAALWARRLGVAEAEPASAGAVAAFRRALAHAERLGSVPGAPVAPPSERFGRREPMRKGMQSIRQEERILSRRMLQGLSRLPGVSVLGEDDPRRAATRTPAFTFTVRDRTAAELGAALGKAGAQVACGDLGSAAALEALGRDPVAGAVRASLAHYHTREEIEGFLEALASIL